MLSSVYSSLCAALPSRASSALWLWHLRGIEWRQNKRNNQRRQLETASSHARHAVSDTGEDRTQTQTPDLRDSRCQTLLTSANVRMTKRGYRVIATDRGRCCEEAECMAQHSTSNSRRRWSLEGLNAQVDNEITRVSCCKSRPGGPDELMNYRCAGGTQWGCLLDR